jgi:hypothetical protein
MGKSETKIKLRAVLAVAGLLAGLAVINHIKSSDPAYIAEQKVRTVAKAEADRIARTEREQRAAAEAEVTRIARAKRDAEHAEYEAKRAVEKAAKEAADKAEAERKAAEPIKFDEETAAYALKKWNVAGCTINGSKQPEPQSIAIQCTDGRVFVVQQIASRIYLQRLNAVTGKFDYVKK